MSDILIKVTTVESASKKEIDLVQMLADDMTRIQIAEKRGLSIRTVEAHIYWLRKKFNIKTVHGLVMLFSRNKLIN